MDRKRSNVNPQNLRRSKRLKTPSAIQGSSHTPQALSSTNAVARWDPHGSEGLKSPTALPFNVQAQRTVLPSTPFLTAQQTDAAISSTSEISRPPSNVHQGVLVQSHEALDGRPGVAAIGEHDQNFQGTQTEDLEGNYFQHIPCAEEISAQSALFGLCNSFSEGSRQPSMSLSGDQAINDQGASIHRSENFPPPLSTPIHDSWRTLAGAYNVCHSQPQHIAYPSDPPVAQFPTQTHMFQSAQKVEIGGNARLMNAARDNVVTNVTNVVKDGIHGLEKMEKFVSFDAQIDSSAQDPERICHPGTRQNVLKRMKDWIDDPSSAERITWLHGPAGAGKSAIAQTIANSCGRQRVAATFFFFRSDASRNDGNVLFPTLAYQLAFSFPAIKDHIVQSLHARPDLPTKGVETQFEHLIALPFRSLAETASPRIVIDSVNQCRQLAPVIIIDGVDECTDERLQQRFLKIIGNAVKDPSFPFRFVVCSRPEAHIEDTLNKFKTLIFSIDLAKLDDANCDIEKYLMEQFSSIATDRGLDPTWPGRDAIKNIIYKSSGNFILASVVIKVVGDEDNVPEDQLDIILNLKPPDRMSPFAALDELYLEILRRQLYQDFLKTFLALLVGRTELSKDYHKSCYSFPIALHEDDTRLMNVSKKVLDTKLRKMRSLLKFEPHIDIHHRSFLDFLNDPSRSGDYYVGKHAGTRRYLELIIDSIVQYVPRVVESPDYHETHHLGLRISQIIGAYPLAIDLAIEELREVSRPLVRIQDEILKLPDSRVASHPLYCDKCNVFDIIRFVLLHLAIHRCIDAAYNEVIEVEELVAKRKCASVITSIRTEAIQNTLGNHLDSSLSSLLTHLQETKLELSPSAAIINHTYSLLHFDCAEIAVKVRSMSDAQRLVDLLVHLIDEKYILNQYNPDAISKATQLVLNICSRIPILPQSLFLNVKRITSGMQDVKAGIQLTFENESGITVWGVKRILEAGLSWRVLDQNYICLEMNLVQRHSLFFIATNNQLRSDKWRKVLPLDPIIVIELAFEVAKAIQYLHSMGCGLDAHVFDIGSVDLDLSLCPKIRIRAESLTLINSFKKTSTRKLPSYEDSVFAFGNFFYRVYFNPEPSGSWHGIKPRRPIIVEHPSAPKIPEYVWQLIQCCCAEDPRSRPTIEEVVKEMEAWRNQPK